MVGVWCVVGHKYGVVTIYLCVLSCVVSIKCLSLPVFKESIFLIIGKILSRARAEIRSGADRF